MTPCAQDLTKGPVWEENDGLLAAPIGQVTMLNNWKGSLRADRPARFDPAKAPAWQSSNKAEWPLHRMPKKTRTGIVSQL